MRLLAAVMIMLCSWLTAGILSDRLRRRKQLLEQAVIFTERMSAQISYALVPPDRVILDCGEGREGFFACCAGYICEGMSVDCAWECAVEECADTGTLSSEERTALSELGSQLGMYDSELQLSALERSSSELRGFLSAASAEYREKSRLGKVCSLLAGALISILII